MDDQTELKELASGLLFPEGPVVLPDGDLAVCELRGGRVSRVPAGGGTPTVLAEPGGSPNGAALGPDGALYICNSGGWRWTEVMPGAFLPGGHGGTQGDDYIGGRIQRIDLASGKVDDVYTECDGSPLCAPNDLVFDATGGMWFTDHGHSHGRVRDLGGVYYARADGSEIRQVVFPLDSPNGIGLSPDGSRLYVADTHTARVYAWELAGPGQLANPNPAFGNGATALYRPAGNDLYDSLAVDGDDNVCVATLVGGGITVVAGDGSSVRKAELPDPMVTNICFGGDDLRTAFVTLSFTGKLVAFEWPCAGLRLAF
ncbi:MAG TPA: SMP-30/gluconolactonase/LRE family protein [Acidimicrobiales bacterium]|nr:SMP-30/gluconolactonase/LRE family protein [Acidimicrobiales bacterium]